MLFLGVGLKHNCREHPKLFANLTIHAMVLSKHANNFFSTEDRRGKKYLELGHSTTKGRGLRGKNKIVFLYDFVNNYLQ